MRRSIFATQPSPKKTKRHPGLTPTDHRTLGLRLQGIHNELCSIYAQLEVAYPRSESAVKQAQEASKAVDKVRCRLDDLVAKEGQPDISWGSTIRVYYGSNVAVSYRLVRAATGPQDECVDEWASDAPVGSETVSGLTAG